MPNRIKSKPEETTLQDADAILFQRVSDAWVRASNLAAYVKTKIAVATSAVSGLMSSTDKAKLDKYADPDGTATYQGRVASYNSAGDALEAGPVIGVGDGGLSANDGALAAGQALFATATGKETKAAADARAALGLSPADDTAFNSLVLAAIAASAAEGKIQRETVQNALYFFANGIGGWVAKGIFSHYAAVTHTGIVTSQSLASATAKGTRTLPANFFKPGKVLKYRLCGVYTTDASPGNATIIIKLGSTTFRTTGSFALDNSVTNGWWELSGTIVCYTDGGTGTVNGQTDWKHEITATSSLNSRGMTSTTAVTIDTTVSQTFDVEWTSTDAGTAVTCSCFALEEIY